MRTRDPKKYLAEINVIPYVDIMLVLLLIFMVTAPFLIQGIKIDLPQVDSAPIEDFENNSLTMSTLLKGIPKTLFHQSMKMLLLLLIF